MTTTEHDTNKINFPLPAEYACAMGREMIKEGLITNPRFIRALQIQQRTLRSSGTYRLLIEIMAEMDATETTGGTPEPRGRPS